MKKFVFATVAVLAVLAITLCLDAQPAGGGAGGGRGGAGGGAGGMGGGGGMMGGGGGGMMGGGMMGGRGQRGPVQRPDKKARLASVAELEKQVATLKAAIEKAPEKDPNLTGADQAAIEKAMADRQPETDAISAIQTSLGALRGAATTGGGARGRGGVQPDVLSELRVLANGEKATKTVARIDELIKAAQTPTRRGGGNRGAGMGGPGGGAAPGAAPAEGRRAGRGA